MSCLHYVFSYRWAEFGNVANLERMTGNVANPVWIGGLPFILQQGIGNVAKLSVIMVLLEIQCQDGVWRAQQWITHVAPAKAGPKLARVSSGNG